MASAERTPKNFALVGVRTAKAAEDVAGAGTDVASATEET
jgi:hypothetical protein